jgi:hypothetical protein
MTLRMDEHVKDWLARSAADAERRGLSDITPLLEGLARAVAALRAADWNEDAGGGRPAREARSQK